MTYGHDELMAFLENLSITTTTYRHEAATSVKVSESLNINSPGTATRNLFLKDKKNQFFLITLEAHAPLDLKTLSQKIAATGRLSFARATYLEEYLGLYPGAVSPFGLINDKNNKVTIILDKALMATPLIDCHPMTNQATTSIRAHDLIRFIHATHHEPNIIAVSQQ